MTADAKPRRDGRRERRQVHGRPPDDVEQRRQALAVEAGERVAVVLDDRDLVGLDPVVLGHELDDRAAPRLRHDGAGRVVEGRDRVDERRPEVLGQLLSQLVDDEPVAVDLDAREHGARVEQHPFGAVVNRVLGDDASRRA